MVNLRRGIAGPRVLIDLPGIDELTEIAADQTGVTIGAGVTLAALARNAAIAANIPRSRKPPRRSPARPSRHGDGRRQSLPRHALRLLQSERMVARANAFCLKYRGNICHVAPQGQRCHAAFSGDLAPALLVSAPKSRLPARKGGAASRWASFMPKTARRIWRLADGELLVAVHLPPAPPPSAYAKGAAARGDRFSAWRAWPSRSRQPVAIIGSLRIALTGTNSRPFLLAGTDAFAGRDGRRQTAAGDRPAGAEAGAADAHHACLGELSPPRGGGAGTAHDCKALCRTRGVSDPASQPAITAVASNSILAG